MSLIFDAFSSIVSPFLLRIFFLPPMLDAISFSAIRGLFADADFRARLSLFG